MPLNSHHIKLSKSGTCILHEEFRAYAQFFINGPKILFYEFSIKLSFIFIFPVTIKSHKIPILFLLHINKREKYVYNVNLSQKCRNSIYFHYNNKFFL